MAKKPVSTADAYYRAASKCALGEQCASDIFDKCLKWGLSEKDAAEVVDKLIKERFIDDARFAGAFTRDKIRYQGWGKIKVAYQLRLKGIDATDISEAADSIDDNEYITVLKKVLTSKLRSLPEKSPYEIRNALARHAASRGFESALIFRAIDEIITPGDDSDYEEYD